MFTLNKHKFNTGCIRIFDNNALVEIRKPYIISLLSTGHVKNEPSTPLHYFEITERIEMVSYLN